MVPYKKVRESHVQVRIFPGDENAPFGRVIGYRLTTSFWGSSRGWIFSQSSSMVKGLRI